MREIYLDTFDQGLHSAKLRGWLRRPHVARWWGDAKEAMEHAVRCRPDAHAVIGSDGTPVGYLIEPPISLDSDLGEIMRVQGCDCGRAGYGEFIGRYNREWLLERHGHRTPADIRASLTRQAA